MFELEEATSWTEQSDCLSSFEDDFSSNLSLPNCTNITHFLDENDATGKPQLNVPYAVLETLVAICAVIGNALVIIVFYRERRLRRRTNYYIISLATADFLVGLLGIPFAILVSDSFLS
jgi:adenosine receptor A2a